MPIDELKSICDEFRNHATDVMHVINLCTFIVRIHDQHGDDPIVQEAMICGKGIEGTIVDAQPCAGSIPEGSRRPPYVLRDDEGGDARLLTTARLRNDGILGSPGMVSSGSRFLE